MAQDRAGLSPAEIRQRVAALGKWFHNLDLNGVATAGDDYLGDYPGDKWHRIKDALPADLAGRTVLDIGCNAGFFAIEMKRRGAERVVAIDHDATYLDQARFAASVLGQTIEFRELSVYDVARIGERFDVVLFMGVLYHLRHPLLALDLIHAHVAKDLLIFQALQRGSQALRAFGADYPFHETAVFDRPEWPKLHFVEHAYAGDPTNWWIPNRACAEAMLRAAGFVVLSRPESDVYVCRRDPSHRPDLPGALAPEAAA